MRNAGKIKKIHIISTVNGQVNEGMRNVATHIAKAFEKKYEVHYSGLKSIISIVSNSWLCDATMIFARANKMVYWLSRLICLFSRNVWIVCVQKPDAVFTTLTKKYALKASYLTISAYDLDDIEIRPGYRKEEFSVGIKTEKFVPVDKTRQMELKTKYGMKTDRPLVIHVGHCSSGRGLEDFLTITNTERLVISSGMFESEEIVKLLEASGVRIHKGYLEHVEEIYQMADVYLFPTRSTEYVISVPLSVMEALACGVPVIGYGDFENLKSIPSEDGAIKLISDKDELNDAIISMAEKKRNRSYLTEPKTWEQSAEEILKKIMQQQGEAENEACDD